MSSGRVRIDPAVEEETGALFEAGRRGVLEEIADDLRWSLVGSGEQTPPGSTVPLPEPVVQDELEPFGVVAGDVAEAPVVDGLAVVGVRSGVEEQAGEREFLTVRRGAAFAAAEHASERCERRR